MGTSHENRRLICEEDRGSEGTREESQRESKRRLVWSGYFGNIAVVLAVGLAVALIGCGNDHRRDHRRGHRGPGEQRTVACRPGDTQGAGIRENRRDSAH